MSDLARRRGHSDDLGMCIPGLGGNPQRPQSGFTVGSDSMKARRTEPSSRDEKPRPQTAPAGGMERGFKPMRTNKMGGAADSSQMSGLLWQPLSPESEEKEEPSSVDEAGDEVDASPFFQDNSGKVVIKGGTIVNCDEMTEVDVLIVDGIITAVGTDLDIPDDAKEIDATNKFVIPGGIDTNTHLRKGMDNLDVVDDFDAGTRAALAGGTTMVIDLVIPRRNESLIDAFNAWKEDAEENSCCDFAFSIAVPQWDDKTKEEMEELIKDLGVNSFKMFMSYKDTFMLGNNDLMKAFEHVKDLGGIAKVHAENGDIIAENQKRLLARGITGPEGHLLAQPEEVEEEAILRACFLAKQANVPVLICAPSSAGAAEVIKEARDKGQVVLGEPTAAALAVDGSHYNNKCWEHAASFITSPPLRDDPNTPDILISALAEDNLQMVGSDNCTFTIQIKKRGRRDFTQIPHGLNGIEDRMAIVYQRGVHEGKMKMTRFVEVTSTAPAKIFNIYPKKGCIAEGSDADIVVWNPNNIRSISSKTQQQAGDFNVFEGISVHGAPEFVLSKGKIVVAEYQLNVCPGSGEFVKTPAFPLELYDKIRDIDNEVNITAVERIETPADDVDGPPPFAKTTPRGYCSEKTYDKSTGTYQRQLSANGVRNQQDSTFCLAGGYNTVSDPFADIKIEKVKRSAIKINAAPGGAETGFW